MIESSFFIRGIFHSPFEAFSFKINFGSRIFNILIKFSSDLRTPMQFERKVNPESMLIKYQQKIFSIDFKSPKSFK